MKFAFAIPGDPETPTGGYAYARRLIAAAPGHGIELSPLRLSERFPFPDEEALRQTAEALAALPAGRPVLIDGLALGALPAEVIAAVPAPVVALCHHPLALETGLPAESARRLAESERAALSACAHVLTTSRATAAILSRDYAVPEERLAVAPPGTDPAPRATGSGTEECRILSVGAVTPRKGHDRLVGALASLGDLHWSLTIAGPERDREAADRLRSAIVAGVLDERVVLAGALSTAALAERYRTADLFALASAYEGFGMAFAEAMAHGLPVVGLTSPAVAEATGGAACLVEPEDLRAALERLIADADARRDLAGRCWQAARGFVRWPETAAIVARVLRGFAT